MALAPTLRRGAGVALTGLGAFTTYRYQQVKAREEELPKNSLCVFETNNTTNTNEQQRVLVIGAGVVGVSTAYKLALRGHQVAVLEPAPEAGEECSACAAGGLSRANVVVDRDSWMAVLKCLVPHPTNPRFRFFRIDWFRSLSDPFFLRWATTFTRTSLFPDEEQEQKQKEMLAFTDYAVKDMVKMLEDPKDDMGQKAGYNKCGSLSVSYDPPAPKDDKENEKGHPSVTRNLEPSRRIDTTEEILDLEPSLAFQEQPPLSASFAYDCKSASSGRFTKELARRCVTDPKLDVTFHYETKVQAIATTQDDENDTKPRISQIHTNRGILSVPPDVHVVVATGAWTPHVLSLMGLYAPVYPLKGYAMSVSAKDALAKGQLKPEDLPSRIVCDKYMYTTRLGKDEIRITSIGEFSEWNTQPTPQVDQAFRKEAIRQFPQLKERITNAQTYCGHRPFVSDGILLLGASDTHQKLYVACGPGTNGWKLAMGSGDVIARLVSGHTTEDMNQELGFDAQAFSPAGRVLHSPWFAKLCRARWNV